MPIPGMSAIDVAYAKLKQARARGDDLNAELAEDEVNRLLDALSARLSSQAGKRSRKDSGSRQAAGDKLTGGS